MGKTSVKDNELEKATARGSLVFALVWILQQAKTPLPLGILVLIAYFEHLLDVLPKIEIGTMLKNLQWEESKLDDSEKFFGFETDWVSMRSWRAGTKNYKKAQEYLLIFLKELKRNEAFLRELNKDSVDQKRFMQVLQRAATIICGPKHVAYSIIQKIESKIANLAKSKKEIPASVESDEKMEDVAISDQHLEGAYEIKNCSCVMCNIYDISIEEKRLLYYTGIPVAEYYEVKRKFSQMSRCGCSTKSPIVSYEDAMKVLNTITQGHAEFLYSFFTTFEIINGCVEINSPWITNLLSANEKKLCERATLLFSTYLKIKVKVILITVTFGASRLQDLNRVFHDSQLQADQITEISNFFLDRSWIVQDSSPHLEWKCPDIDTSIEDDPLLFLGEQFLSSTLICKERRSMENEEAGVADFNQLNWWKSHSSTE